MSIVVCLDPGTGVKSPTGFAAFDSKTNEILWAIQRGSAFKPLRHRIRDISDAIEETMLDLEIAIEQDRDVLCCIESFVMKGKGGETLQRLIGSLMGRVPYRWEFIEVPNTTVKKVLGGHGHAEKAEVAKGVFAYFSTNKKSKDLIEQLIIRGDQWDVLDAFAIGIVGFKKHQGAV